MYDPSQTPLISETLLKKRRSLEDLAFRRSVTLKNQNKRKRVVRGEDVRIKRPEQFVREFRIKEGSLNKMKRRKREIERRSSATVTKPLVKDTVGLIVRIHAGRHSSEEIKAQLRGLQLNRKYDAVFANLNEETIRSLKPIDAYCAYGYVSEKSVIELVHRRAHTSVSGSRMPLMDNITVEKLLGDKGILCLNDLSHEIYTVGTNFDPALQVLSTFKLAAPVGHYEKVILKQNDKVEERGGFLGDAMDEFLAKIL